MQQLRCELQRFAEERDWQMFHTPRNLLLALVRPACLPACLRLPLPGCAPGIKPSLSPCPTKPFLSVHRPLPPQTGEVGELAECFQWKGEVAAGLPGFPPGERQHVGAPAVGRPCGWVGGVLLLLLLPVG